LQKQKLKISELRSSAVAAEALEFLSSEASAFDHHQQQQQQQQKEKWVLPQISDS
jgi:hypothetical protein